MGLFGIGDDHRKKITDKELEKKVFPELANGGDPNTRLSHHERERIKQFLEPLTGGGDSYHQGIDKGELDRAMHALREHPHDFVSSSKKLDRLEKDLKKQLDH
jgi:hypothetical protein